MLLRLTVEVVPSPMVQVEVLSPMITARPVVLLGPTPPKVRVFIESVVGTFVIVCVPIILLGSFASIEKLSSLLDPETN